MRTSPLRPFVLALTLIAPETGGAPAQTVTPTASPINASCSRDEGADDRSFAQFRKELREVVRARDSKALRGFVSPNILVETSRGMAALTRHYHPEQKESAFWIDVDVILGQAAVRQRPTVMCAPAFSCPPIPGADIDTYYVMSKNVPVRARPLQTGDRIGEVSCELVNVSGDGMPPPIWEHGWSPIRFGQGWGYVEQKYMRSPADLRMVFEKRRDRWMLAAYVAAD